MQGKYIDTVITYDGTQLSSLWAFRSWRIQGDSIVAFSGPCRVALSEMVDQADVLDGAYIYSENMLHFIVEHFDMNLETTVTRQRLLIAIIKDLIAATGYTGLIRKGDDLYAKERKLSVSIATLSPVSTLIHTGLNIDSRNTPVPTVGLPELGINPAELALQVIAAYTEEIESIRMARCKVRGVG